MIGLFFLISYCLCWNLVYPSLVRIEDNAYKGIVVAIDEGIQAHRRHKIVTAIKDMFTSASAFLYNATKKRAYFGEVTILLPKHWTKESTDEDAGNESFGRADVRISFPNFGFRQYNNLSYTEYQEECGKGGKFIHINEGHLLKTEPHVILDTIYGDPGRWLTKHWAIYRYGIYEEHGLIGCKNFPTFYQTGDSLQVTGCSDGFLFLGEKLNFLNATESCEEINDIPTENCYYSSKQDRILSSFAFDSANTKIQHFCDSKTHNTEAPTPHREFCKNQSTWSVIMQHEDFINNNNSPRDVNDTIPKFRIVIPRVDKRFVILLDTSSSMNGTYLEMVNSALENAVIRNLPYRSVLGMVAFNETARVLLEMRVINTNIDKEVIISNLPKIGEGSTCIGCGLRKTVEMVKSYDRTACTGINIILISDGNENERDRIINVMETLKEESVRVFTIAFANYADEHLNKLSTETNGKSCFLPNRDITTENDFYECIVPIFSDNDPSTTMVKSNKNNIISNMNNKVMVDNQADQLEPQAANLIFKTDEGKVEGWINVDGKQIDATTQRVSVYGYAYSKDTPLNDLDIYAEVTLPNDTRINVQLFDNGIQPDVFKGDGVYSRYFLDFIGNGRYIVNLQVYRKPSSSRFTGRREISTSLVKHISIGSFRVKDKFHSETHDIYPPNAIEDLNIVNFNKITYEITLNWTAPGNNFDVGQARRYELKYHHKFPKLQQSFDAISNKITKGDLKFGSLTPSPSGREEKIVWTLPRYFYKKFYSVHFAIRAIDESNNYAKLSNIATLRIKPLACPHRGWKFPVSNDLSAYFVCERNYGPPTKMKCPLGTMFVDSLKLCT